MSCEVIALAAICVLAIVLIYQYRGSKSGFSCGESAALNSADPYDNGGYPPHNPGYRWELQNPQLYPRATAWESKAGGASCGQRRWPNSNMSQKGLATAGADPDRVAAAEREAWYPSDVDVDTYAIHPRSGDCGDSDTAGMDYSRYVTDSIVDPRMAENHRKWVEELGPWSGELRSVDNMDEALEASIHFVGLQRPQGVPVHNPTQVTELGPDILAGNPKFRFNG